MKCIEILDTIMKTLSDRDGEFLVALDKEIENEDVRVSLMAQIIDATVIIKSAKELLIESTTKEKEITGEDEDLEVVAGIAKKFDKLGLKKEASVLDELLLTIAADKTKKAQYDYDQEEKINKLREKFRKERGEELYADDNEGRKFMKKNIGAEEMEKNVNNNVKKFRPMEASLSTRYSPDMPGVQLIRVGDNVYQCPVTGKTYDFNAGYTTAKGNKVPGGDVQGQTANFGYSTSQESTALSSRQDKLDGNTY